MTHHTRWRWPLQLHRVHFNISHVDKSYFHPVCCVCCVHCIPYSIAPAHLSVLLSIHASTSGRIVFCVVQCSLLSAYNQLIGKWHKIEVIIFTDGSFEIQISRGAQRMTCWGEKKMRRNKTCCTSGLVGYDVNGRACMCVSLLGLHEKQVIAIHIFMHAMVDTPRFFSSFFFAFLVCSVPSWSEPK